MRADTEYWFFREDWWPLEALYSGIPNLRLFEEHPKLFPMQRAQVLAGESPRVGHVVDVHLRTTVPTMGDLADPSKEIGKLVYGKAMFTFRTDDYEETTIECKDVLPTFMFGKGVRFEWGGLTTRGAKYSLHLPEYMMSRELDPFQPLTDNKESRDSAG